MKRIVLLTVMLTAMCSAKGQLKVNALGNIGIGTDPETGFKMTINSNKGGQFIIN